MCVQETNPMHSLLKFIIYTPFIQRVRLLVKPLFHFFYKDLHKKTFTFGGNTYHYFSESEYNVPWKNERAVEISIAMDYLERYKNKRVLEVGNVLSNYVAATHDVLDPYENAPFLIKEDIVKYKPQKKYDLILCISTLEHVGWDLGDEKGGIDPYKPLRAFEHMKELLADNGELFVTIPFGYNPHMDNLLLTRQIQCTRSNYMKRVSIRNYWREVTTFTQADMTYGVVVMAARLLFVGVFQKK